VAGCCEHENEHSDSGATELVCFVNVFIPCLQHGSTCG
jgi:hypothetical protein